MSFGTSEWIGVLSSLITAPLGPIGSAVVGIMSTTATNIANDVIASGDIDERKRRLKELVRAPTVANAGTEGANGQLADLLLDAIGYTMWVEVATLDDLWKFRIPPEFPEISLKDLEAAIATAMISYQSIGDIEDEVSEFWSAKTFFGHWPAITASNIVLAKLEYLRESEIEAVVKTDAPLGTAVRGRSIGELKNVPIIFELTFPRQRGSDPPDAPGYDPGFEEDANPPRVVFGKDNGRLAWRGTFLGLYYMHSYIHPEDKPPTYEDIRGPVNGQQWSQEDTMKAYFKLKNRYNRDVPAAADLILHNSIYPYVLGSKHR
jgi:hypothetical protein